jgi:2-polyprenyl-3-methyl-5-hydroxy-6-metoxy-1,4-benzoquinol methylase
MIKRAFIEFLRKTRLILLANKITNLRNSFLKKKAIKNGKSDIEAIYDKNFFQENIEVSTEGARKCIDILYKEFKPKKVIDFGCGPGIFIKEFEKKGVKVLGIDGSMAAKEKAVIDKEKIIIKDLRNEVNIKGKFDLTICFEVAEHIDNKYSEILVKNVTKNSKTVLFTAAKKGQGGMDHINEQDPEFWIDLFKKQKFEFQEELTKKLKKEMKEQKVLWWIPENIMVFKKK